MSTPARGELVIHPTEPGCVIAMYNPLILVHQTRAIRTDELQLLQALADEAHRNDVGVGFFVVNAREELGGGVEPEVRAGFAELIQNTNDFRGASAMAILTDGLGAAVLRTVLTQLVRLWNRGQPIQAFGSVANACRWLAKQHRLDVRALEQAHRNAVEHRSG